MIYKAEILKKMIDYLEIRFPVKELSETLGYSKGAVSNYLNGNKPVSESFVHSLENHYNISYGDFCETKDGGIGPDLTLTPDNIKKLSVFISENKVALMGDPLFKMVIQNLFLTSEIKSLRKIVEGN